jgi:hypothetical protein
MERDMGLLPMGVEQRAAAVNSAKITGIMPASTGFSVHRIEIHTQYTGSGSTSLKVPRVITSAFTIEEA